MLKTPKTKPEKLKAARKWVRDLQKILPCCEKVYVVAADPNEEWGECVKRRRGFEIAIDWSQTMDVIETFLLPHEYTHSRVWGRLQLGNHSHDGHFDLELGVVIKAADTMYPHEDIG